MRLSRVCMQAFQHHASSSSLSARSNSISFLGLGRMGSQMALNLFSKHHALASDTSFVVCDAVPETARSFTEDFRRRYPAVQISVVDTPEQAALASQTIITMLPSSPQVRSVFEDEHGILSALQSLPPEIIASTLCIDSTTLDVNVARTVAKSVHAAGARMVDAPVSGGVTGANAGTLSFLVGGTEESFAFASPFLTLMGKRIIHCGPSGAGLVAKICNNLILGVQQIVTAEAMLLGQRLGVQPKILADVINSSTGACWACSVNNPVPGSLENRSAPCENDYEGGFATALMLKDMGLATDSAQATQSPLPLGDAAKGIYEDVMHAQPDLARKDFSSVYKYLEDISTRRKS